MRVSINGHAIDSLGIVTGDHLLTAIAQLDLLDNETLEWLLVWSDTQIRTTRDECARAVLRAFNTLAFTRLQETQ